MELIDLIVLIFFLFVLVGLSYSKAHKDTLLLNESFEDSPQSSVNVYLFYSMISQVPGKKCRENYKLYKENRFFMQVWNKFKQYLIVNHPNVQTEAINIDDNPEYVEQFNIEKTPVIYMEKDGVITQLTRDQLPNLQDLVNKFRNSNAQTKDLAAYNDAIVYLYVPNCMDCKKYLYEWLVFKKQIKTEYPDIKLFEVDVSKNPSYKKYVYRFSPSVYPLILTKSLGKIVTTDIIELYGAFTADNLFALTEEYFFNQLPDEVIVEENQVSVPANIINDLDTASSPNNNSLQLEQEKINEMISYDETAVPSGEDLITESDLEVYNENPRFPIPNQISDISLNQVAPISRRNTQRMQTNQVY